MLQELIRFSIKFIEILLTLLYYCIFIRVLMSWFASGKSPLGEWLDSIVRPILKPFRWARIGMLDFSPIVALVVISFVAGKLTQFLAVYLNTV